jgi:hypothetical protein
MSLMEQTPEKITPKKLGPTWVDILFLIFLVGVLISVTLLGRLAFEEGMKTERSKENGEAWVKWLTDNSAERFKEGFQPSACAGGPVVAAALEHERKELMRAARLAAKKAGTEDEPITLPDIPIGSWGECFKALTAKGGALADQINAFSLEPLTLVAKCDPGDLSTAGGFLLEKNVSTPVGSAIPQVTSTLADNDLIVEKVNIRITICDKGAYPTKIAEFDF